MSTNIDLNLIGGELLGRDARNRDDQREAQLKREKAAKKEKEFVDSAVKRVQLMKGERGNAGPDNKAPAAFPPSSSYSLALAFFNRPLGNGPGTFQISTKSGQSVSWDVQDLGAGLPTPEKVDTPDLQRTGYVSGAGLSRNSYAMMLPISKSTCIACWVSGGLRAAHSTTFDRTRTVANRVEFSRAYNHYTPPVTVGGETYPGVWRTLFTNCPFRQNNLSNIPNSYPANPPDFYNKLDSSYSTYELTLNQVGSFNIVERNVFCALITGNTIRKIKTPAVFIEKALRLVDIAEASIAEGEALAFNTHEQEDLKLWWKASDGNPVLPGGIYQVGSSADFIVSAPARDPDRIWDRAPAGRSMISVGYDYSLTGNGKPLYKQVLNTTITSALYAAAPDLNKMLGVHYGLGYETPYTETSHGSTQGFYTPAIYSYLNDVLPIVNNNMRSYAYVDGFFKSLGVSPPAKLIVQSTEGLTSTGKIAFYETSIPTGLTVEADLSNLGLTKKQTVSYDTALGFPYVAWDWGNAAYNRSQLLALGFSNTDLS